MNPLARIEAFQTVLWFAVAGRIFGPYGKKMRHWYFHQLRRSQ